MCDTMTDYDYILAQCRKTDSNAWNDESVKDSMKRIVFLSEQELCDLLFEKEVPFYPEENSEAIVINDMQDKLKSAIIKAIPTDKLVEIMNSSPSDYIVRKGREHSMNFFNTFLQSYSLVREELLGRYISRVDIKIEGNIFSKEQEKKRWQKWQQEEASIRYHNPYLKRFEKDEIFYTDEDLEHGLIGFNHVISIKGCSRFWNEDRMRLGVTDYILANLCDVVPQYLGIGDEVVFAVAPGDYNLHEDFDNTPLHDKLYEVIDKEYQRNLVLGCLLIEKFIHLVDSKTHAKVRYYDREYLVGHFVMEECDTYKLFGANPFLSFMEKMNSKEKEKFNSFLELAKILLNPPPKAPF